MNYEGAKKYAISRLENELPTSLHYHNVYHTYDVLNSINMYANFENISGENLILLLTAGCFHDLGFVEIYFGHEIVGARIAREVLPSYDYSDEQIEKICGMILATQITVEPKNMLEKVMCDSDLDYLGREDFNIRAQTLKIEFYERNIIKDEKGWEEKQLFFMQKHKFYTSTAKKLRNKNKKYFMNELKILFEKY